MDSYLDTLNAEQKQAVLHSGPPLLILAGAGSGKTRVITTKIAFLIRERGVDPRAILAVTFTNKAAREMAGRACQIEPRAEGALLRTFHSFGAWFLRRNAGLAGLDPGFVIYDEDDTIALLATITKGVNRPNLKTYAWGISLAKDRFLSPEAPELSLIDNRSSFREAYAAYEEKKAAMGVADFGDLIKKPVEMLRAYPDLAARYRERFKVIMVDEYQDANTAQFLLLRELWRPENYLCVVGDDDQSIYRFRGADIENILRFAKQFPGTETIKLERNYRSTARILRAASSVVAHNTGRLGKTLIPAREEGKMPALAFLPTQEEEAVFCAELIEAAFGKGTPYKDWAILYRTNAQSMGFENELLRRRIPYRVVGSLKFYEREEVKDALALLAFTANPRDEVAFRRVVNKPVRALGASSVERILGALSVEDKGDIEKAARRAIERSALQKKAAQGIRAFLDAIERGREALARGAEADSAPPAEPPAAQEGASRVRIRGGTGLSVCLAALLEASGLAEYHRERDDLAGSQRLGNLQELTNAASLYEASLEGLSRFLEFIELDRGMSDAAGTEAASAVTLITLHNTKGLEFPRVIMTGVEEGIFPRMDKGHAEMEEERRLFYVGATRARDELYFSACMTRRIFGRTIPMSPSPFLREIDPQVLRILGNAPHGFRTRPPAGGGGALAPRRKTSSDGLWSVGDRFFHDDRGPGSVIRITESEDGPVITAQFDTGGETFFLSGHQSGAFLKVAE